MTIQINKNEEIWLIWKKNYFKGKRTTLHSRVVLSYRVYRKIYIPKRINLGFRETAHLPLPITQHFAPTETQMLTLS